MLVINYKGNIPQQNFYSIGVKQNNKANKIMFVLNAIQQDVDLSVLRPYLKLQSKEGEYIDKIVLTSQEDTIQGILDIEWLMTSKSMQYRNLQLQLQFQSDNSDEIVWQTMIVEIELSETIKADEEISEKYPTELKQLETEVNSKVDKVDGMGLSHNDFTDGYKNKLDGIEDNAQVNKIESIKLNNITLPITNKVVEIDLSEDYYDKDQVDTFAKSLVVSIDSNYVMTFTLKDNNNNALSTQTIDLPLESVVVGGNYDNTTKSLILTLDNGSTITIPVSDLVDGLVSQTDLATALASYYTKGEVDTLLGGKENVGYLNGKALPSYPTDLTKKYKLIQEMTSGNLAWEVEGATLSIDCYAPIGDSTELTGISVEIKDFSDEVIASGTYNGETLKFSLPINQTYKVVIETTSLTISGITYFNPTASSDSGTLTQDTSIIFRYASTQSMTTLADVKSFLALQDISIEVKRQAIVRSETNAFSVDIEITNPANNTKYTMPIYFLEVDTYEKLVNGVATSFLGARCQFAYALPDSIPFDEREQIQTENGETFASGIYYYSATSSGVGDKVFTPLVEGTDYQIGDDIDTYESTNNVYVFKHAWSNTQYGSGNSSTANLIRYGSNIYHESNIHKWLNASGNDWFVASHLGDRLGTWYEGKYGFKNWFKNTDLAQIENDVAYGVYERSGLELTNNKLYCMFVLPSGTEMAGSCNSNEGNVFDYWKYLNGDTISNNANADRTIKKITAMSSPQYAWFRSPYRSGSYSAWSVNASGYVNVNYVYYAYACLPTFTI